MEAILKAQSDGANFSTLVQLRCIHLEFNVLEMSKVLDTACQYVSYCSNPVLLPRYREPLDWVMLLFFVVNNNTSTYKEGTETVPLLTKVIEVLNQDRNNETKSSDNI